MSFNREAYERNYRVTGRARGVKVTTQCLQCGIDISYYQSQNARRFCSLKCKGAADEEKVTVPCSSCGKPIVTIPSRLKWSQIRGRGRIFCDKECQRVGNSEENHPCWIEDREQIKRPRAARTLQYRQWRTAVFERDKYTCQKCGKVGGYLHAHHIKEWEYYPELRYDVGNGQTLCRRPCHKEVHDARRTNRKMSDTQVNEAKNLRRQGMTLREIGKRFGVSESRISTICSGKKRKHELP